MASLTPMMRQYMAAKEAHPDAILLFRMGDFYELFYEDAKTAARVLDLTLTSRDKNSAEPVPMAGVPYHAVQGYLSALVRKGYNVAICEQMEDPKLAKGIVKREVVRVITPGTLTDGEMLEASEKNFLAAVARHQKALGLAFVDASTGEFYLTEFTGPESELAVLEELGRIAPAEVLVAEGPDGELMAGKAQRHGRVTRFREDAFDARAARSALLEQFQVQNLKGFGCEAMPAAIAAAGANVAYLRETQKSGVPHLRSLHVYDRGAFMVLDETTRRNLEITRTLRGDSRKGSLLGHMDRTVTAPGSRTLAGWLVRPLLDIAAIGERLDAVEELRQGYLLRHEVRASLGDVKDLERLATKVALGTANARDLVAIRETLKQAPAMQGLLADTQAAALGRLSDSLTVPADLLDTLERSLIDEPPLTVREGGMFREGFREDLDELRSIESTADGFLSDLETREREATGLNRLKVKFNNIFGYFIEIPRSQAKQAPERYIRKQTLTNAERYITPELKEFEEKALDARDRLHDLEYRLFQELVQQIAARIDLLQQVASAFAQLDVLAAFAEIAQEGAYSRPEVNGSAELRIVNGRHPVVEGLIGRHAFVANDCAMGESERRLLLLTGPNMAGKSTYIRQVAIIVLLAQVGSFVPADSAIIGIADRIFTRVGASDNLVGGESTFMVEMNEAANILNNATNRSLVVFDELGRGTSANDGFSIAWAVTEHILESSHLRCRTLFATHYHELAELQVKHKLAANISVDVQEHAGEVTFLHRIVEGAAEQSFGVHVARLAGMPSEVIQRATEICDYLDQKRLSLAQDLESGQSSKGRRKKTVKMGDDTYLQMEIFTGANDPLRQQLSKVNPNALTPMEAHQLVAKLKEILSREQ